MSMRQSFRPARVPSGRWIVVIRTIDNRSMRSRASWPTRRQAAEFAGWARQGMSIGGYESAAAMAELTMAVRGVSALPGAAYRTARNAMADGRTYVTVTRDRGDGFYTVRYAL